MVLKMLLNSKGTLYSPDGGGHGDTLFTPVRTPVFANKFGKSGILLEFDSWALVWADVRFRVFGELGTSNRVPLKFLTEQSKRAIYNKLIQSEEYNNLTAGQKELIAKGLGKESWINMVQEYKALEANPIDDGTEPDFIIAGNGAEAVWQDTMTPIDHYNPNKHFQYIVHALYDENDPQVKDLLDAEGIKDIRGISNYINLWNEPNRIAERKLLSTSIINERKRTVWNDVGLVLKVPSGNILKAAPHDLGTKTITATDEDVDHLYKQRNLPDPIDVLNGTDWMEANEIVITGTGKDGKRVEVAGVYTVVDIKTRKPINPVYDRRIRALAKKINVPVIEINESEREPNVQPIKTPVVEKNIKEPGGIDLTQANINLQTRNDGSEIKFHLNPAMLARLQKAPGFTPVIINIQPMTDLKAFLTFGVIGNSQINT